MEPKVIDEAYDFRKYDFSSIIKQEDCVQAMSVIDSIIASGNYFENSPKFQTKENIFARNEECWLKFRMSFIFAAFMYLGKEVQIKRLQSWSFVTSLNHPEDRDRLWHDHQCENKTVSGILYLQIPNDVANYDLCGTEFAPSGLDGNDKFFIRPAPYSWLMYPGKTLHRPGVVQSHLNRYVLAADIEF